MADPRILDMMRQKARLERPMPQDIQELMETAVKGDPQSIRLIEEQLDTRGMSPVDYARAWLGPENSIFMSPTREEAGGQVVGLGGEMEATHYPPGTEPTNNQFVAADRALKRNLGLQPDGPSTPDDMEMRKQAEIENLKKMLQALELKNEDEAQ